MFDPFTDNDFIEKMNKIDHFKAFNKNNDYLEALIGYYFIIDDLFNIEIVYNTTEVYTNGKVSFKK